MDVEVLLVQAPNVTGTFFNLPGREIPLSLCSLGAYLRNQGIGCSLLDLDQARDGFGALEQTLSKWKPRIVGISAYTPNVAFAGAIAEKVKSLLPKTRVILGGFHASALPDRTLREFGQLDYIAVGEGEVTLTELVYAERDGQDVSEIAGLRYREGDQIRATAPRGLFENLDELPFPDRDLIPVREYVPDPGNYFALPTTSILYARGCPYRCTFCSKSVFGDRIRYRSEENFLTEVEECIGKFGIRDFRLADEAPTVNMKRIRSLARAILARGLKITWNCFSRVDSVDEDTLNLMKESGCYHITYGIESSIPETLEKIQKKIDLAAAEATIRLTRRLGIECKANFILGFPWESAGDMRGVIRFARKISPDLVTFNLFKPLPGSRLYDELDKSGRLKHRTWEDYFTTSEGLLFDALYTEEEALKILRWAVFSFYFRPSFAWQRLRRLTRNPRREISMLCRGLVILGREIVEILLKAFRKPGPKPV